MSHEFSNGNVCRPFVKRIWRKSCIQLNISRYTKQRNFCNRLVHKAKSDVYSNMNSNNSDNPRQLQNSIDRTLHRKAYVSLSTHDSTNSLGNSFFQTFQRSPKFMLLSQDVLLVVILIFQLYITLAHYLNQPYLITLLN